MAIRLVLVGAHGKQSVHQWRAERSLARDMLGYLREKLEDAGVDFASITGIGVFRGPGSYTGLRIGMTVLNTLAAAQKIPIVGSVETDWETECLERLEKGENDEFVLPEYGGEAHITKPKK